MADNESQDVAVMLFDSRALHPSTAPDNVEGHSFHAADNTNGAAIASILDCRAPPLDPRVQALQEADIRWIIDTAGDLTNILYEVANESSGGRPSGAAGAESRSDSAWRNPPPGGEELRAPVAPRSRRPTSWQPSP
jgi:hypothetical protein